MRIHFSKLRSLKGKIFFYIIVLLLSIQFVAFWAISLMFKEHEEQRLKSELTSATTIFQTHFMSEHALLNKFNQTSNKILAEYFNEDTKSFLQVLDNFRSRINADLVMSINKDGLIKAQIIMQETTTGTRKPKVGEEQGKQYRYPLERLSRSKNNKFYQLNNEIYQYSISEVRVANIETIGWIGFGSKIDNLFANKFSKLIGFEVDFYLKGNTSCTLLASSRTVETNQKQVGCFVHSTEFEKSKPLVLGSLGDKNIQVVIYGLRENILSSLEQNWLLLSALIVLTLIFSLSGAYLIAASISRPVRILVKQAKQIASGNYDISISLNDSAEFGQLANEFNLMKKAVLEREQEILHNASHDPLTDLPNRSRLFNTLSKWCKQRDIEHAIFIIKIDHIKEINESLGHEVADQVIKEVSERLKLISSIDLLAHLRANEFVLLVYDISKISVEHCIDNISKVLEIPYCIGGMSLILQSNIGISLSDESDGSPSDFLRLADSALQLACKNKQPYQLYNKSLDEDRAERLSLMNDLHTAIAGNQFRLYYQPKLTLATGKVAHVEALIRWFHPEKGLIPPDKFIPIAESTGQIGLITLWVLEEAARQHAEWKKKGLNLSIAVNVSAQDLKNEKIYSFVEIISDKYDLETGSLQLEITESAVVEDPESAIELLSKFNASGIGLSIDDYGTGYSSLAQLKQLPVNELKIDMSFIRRIPDDEDDKIIVKSTIELAHNMGLSVVAEGVETEAALNWLKQQGCDLIQGYFISRPLPAEEFIQWIKESEYI